MKKYRLSVGVKEIVQNNKAYFLAGTKSNKTDYDNDYQQHLCF